MMFEELRTGIVRLARRSRERRRHERALREIRKLPSALRRDIGFPDV
jgi:hypothetical protein